MEQASTELNFEQAAEYRDQLISLQKVQEQQCVTGLQGDADVVACAIKPGGVCIYMLFVRGGRVIGSKSYHPKVSVEQE